MKKEVIIAGFRKGAGGASLSNINAEFYTKAEAEDFLNRILKDNEKDIKYKNQISDALDALMESSSKFKRHFDTPEFGFVMMVV